jgi:hypothetical protein
VSVGESVWAGKGLELFSRRIPQHSNRRFSACCAESLMAMESLVSLTVSVAKNFYFLHLAVVFFPAGKEFKQPVFKQFIRLGRSGKELPPPCA